MSGPLLASGKEVMGQLRGNGEKREGKAETAEMMREAGRRGRLGGKW